MAEENKKPILCLDFDGVCHAYTSPWTDKETISDGAVPGLFEFLEEAQKHFDIQIFSSRSDDRKGRAAMANWFRQEIAKWRTAGGESTLIEITFPPEKPPAFVGLDDRVLTFTGIWPDVEALRVFRPWNK